jgi:lipopolysaccharide export LptBFGC system permease protein LptF
MQKYNNHFFSKDIMPKKRPIAREFVEEREKKKQAVELNMQRFVAWTAMLLLICINALGALLLLPFMLFFEGYAQYAVVAVFAVGFGFIFNMMIHSLKHLGDKHHIIAAVVVPCFAIVDLVILFFLLEKISTVLKITVQHNYTVIIVLFILAFIIPYLFDIIRGKHRFM